VVREVVAVASVVDEEDFHLAVVIVVVIEETVGEASNHTRIRWTFRW
jgi:hypothetical protein